ncbi:hypothetical protein K474DRAFT_1661142 [Panus rudis PR-1116 ss-1]|nr:hypothetical protein K474DRAFT_1661142 [Panus rudis PR-1116 ss-1]
MVLQQLLRTRRHNFLTKACSRWNSTSAESSTYPSKVRAYPFAITLEDAKTRIGPTMSMYFVGKDILHSLAAKYLPFLGAQPIQPSRAEAAYLPVWLIDAEVTAKTWISRQEEETVQQEVVIQFDDSYMSGFLYEPLSRTSFRSSGLRRYSNVPWENSLQRQLDQDILCLPFQFTPFSLPSFAQLCSMKDAVITEGFRFDPNSIRTTMLAAYPLLIPVYIMRYDYPMLHEEPVSLTVVVEAYRREGRWFLSNVLKQVPELRQLASRWADPDVFRLLDKLEFYPRGPNAVKVPYVANIEGISGRHMTKTHATVLSYWLDEKYQLESHEAYLRHWKAENTSKKPLKGKDAEIDWDDLRIREYVPQEKAANKQWAILGQVEASYAVALKTVASADKVAAEITTYSDDLLKDKGGMIVPEDVEKLRAQSVKTIQGREAVWETLKASLKSVSEARQKYKPQWLIQWEALQDGGKEAEKAKQRGQSSGEKSDEKRQSDEEKQTVEEKRTDEKQGNEKEPDAKQ